MLTIHLTSLLAAASWSAVVQAKVHHLFVSNRNAPPEIHSVEFNDETGSLELVQSMKADSTYMWMSFSHDQKSIYASSLQDRRVASYSVVDPVTVELSGTIPTTEGCGGTTAFSVASTLEPYRVYTARYPGPASCGMSLSTKEDGSLDGVDADWLYANNSGVHGLALGVRNGTELLLSADITGDAVWLHSINATGEAELLSRLPSPDDGGDPRHLLFHPNMAWAYIVMESGNALVALKLEGDEFTTEGSFTHTLIPEDADKAKYWSSNVKLSPNNRYLWVTARGREGQNVTSQVSCFLLNEDGAVVKALFRQPSGVEGKGSGSIAIMPAPWSDEYAIYSDSPGGYVEVLKLDGRNETELGVEYSTAKSVARLQIAAKSCCANALWYD